MKIIVCSPFQICSQYTQQEKDISTPSSDKIIIISIIIRLAALLLRSASGRQQPPEWSVLGQVDCLGS